MNKIIKKISLLLTSLGLVLLIGGVISSLIFSEQIESAVVKNLKEQIPTNLEIGDVDFQLFDNFPFSTVKINKLYIQEDVSFGNDTLLYAESAYVSFSVIKFIFNTFSIENISINSGKISIKESANKTNYAFLKNNNNNETEIKLEEIKLVNTVFNYSSQPNKTELALICSNIKLDIIEKNNYNIDGSYISKKTEIYNKEYLENKKVKVNINYLNTDGIEKLKSSSIDIEGLQFFVKGFLNQEKYLDLEIIGEKQNIKSFTQNTPKHLRQIYASILLDGIINYNAIIKGKIGSQTNPHLTIDYSVTEGVFETKKYPFYLSNISCNGIIDNGLNNNFKSSSVSFNNFDGKTKKGNIKGEFLLSNLADYYLNADLISVWQMDEANYYFEESPFYECNGQINAKTKYEGKISFDENFNNHFLNGNHYSEISLTDLNFLYRNYPVKINVAKCNAQIYNDSIKINNSLINIKDSDIKYVGIVKNLFNYILLNSNSKIELVGDLNSKTINLKTLMASDEKDEENLNEFVLPEYLTFRLNSKIETLVYNNIYPNNINGNLYFKDNSISSKDLELNIFDGKMSFDGKFYKNEKNNFKLTSNIKLEKIDVKKGFSAFNNFGQDFIQDKHIKGLSSSRIICNMYWDKYLNLNYESIDVNSKITIEKGELIDFKPLESLSAYVKLKDLEHIKFSKLENEIKIKDKIISIPNMEINSSALSLIISGKHFFNREYNYKVSLLLSDLLAKRFRSKRSDFNPNDSISPLKTDLQIRMKGNKDDSEIYFEKLKIKENIKQEIKKEIIDVKKIISEELKKKEKDEESEDLEIEWDDNP